MSLTYNTYSSGATTLPCGTPASRVNSSEIAFPTRTVARRSVRKLENQRRSEELMSKLIQSLKRRPSCQTLSKALLTSRKIDKHFSRLDRVLAIVSDSLRR
jgi:CRISPR/Cas system-associated protein Csm6